MSDRILFSRRMFLSRGAQLLSVAGTLPLFLDRSARAMAAEHAVNPQGVGRPDRVLVVVQLAGGNDGLNTVVPFRSDDYYKARPRLAVARNAAIKLTDDLGVHPSLKGLARLYEAGRLASVQCVGYPNPNRSHFRSTDSWAPAEPQKVASSGWLGRYFDSCCKGEDPSPDPATKTADASAAIALTGEPPQALQGEKFLPLVFRSPQALTYRPGSSNRAVADAFEKINSPDAMSPATRPADADQTTQFLQRTALTARLYADRIRQSTTRVQNKATYPATRFAADLKLLAQMIADGLPTRVYYVSMGGFDTHSQQADRHARLLTELGDGLSAFVADLDALGHLGRTTIMTFSEFGRRVAENNSIGTDHGEAAPMFILGGKVKVGIHGPAPDLAPGKLHRGDVPYAIDFRRVYATVLRSWLSADDRQILGNSFQPLPLFA